MSSDGISTDNRPPWVEVLQQAFGGPSQTAFGTAVFFECLHDQNSASDSGVLERRARDWYQFFCGPNWERFGPENWLGAWRCVYSRTIGSASIINELAEIKDSQAHLSAATMIEGAADAEAARSALKQAFDGPSLAELQIYNIGDGEAMSGILIAGRHVGGEAAFVTFLLD